MYTLLPIPPLSFIRKHDDIHPIVATLLWQRGVRTKSEIEEFLSGTYYQTDEANRKKYNPFHFKEMEKVVKRLLKAAQDNERVLVYGDYDADGVCSAVLMIETLEKLYGIRCYREQNEKHKKLDALIQVYLPHREEEGYGLNSKAVEYIIKQEVALVITCDCGSGNREELKSLQEAKIDTIVLDHHLAPETRPPVYGFINPRFKEDAYEFNELAAAGVVFKVVQGLRQYLQKVQEKPAISESFEKWALDLVALATVADMMPLKGENRILVKWGLVVLNKTRRIGMRALIDSAGLTRKIGTYEIGFVLAPRVNAAGRLDHANVAFDLLRQDDPKKVREDADKLNKTNEDRQRLAEKIFNEAQKQVQEQVSTGGKVLVAYNTCEGAWPSGIVGLVAGKLAQTFFRPAFVIGDTKHGFAGSGRSIPGFDITALLHSMNELFIRVGGHPGAAGFTFTPDREKKNLIDEFKKKATAYAGEHLSPENLAPPSFVDMEIPFSHINWKLIQALTALQPFGQENPPPLFLTRSVVLESLRSVGAGGSHRKLILSSGGIQHQAIMFRGANHVKELKQGDSVLITYSIEVNEWKGSKTIQLILKGLKPC